MERQNPGISAFDLSGGSLLNCHSFLCASCIFQVNGPNYGAILKAQANGIPVLIAFTAINDFPAHGNLIQQGSDFRGLAWLPGTIRNHARAVRADVIRVRHLRASGTLSLR
jgi:hypothetical protein